MELINRKTAELIPYINNSRTHDESQVKQIASSIQEFGFTNPILIDKKDSIIAGHGRLLAAELLKLEEVPTITLSGLSEAQKKAYIIADNKLALNAGWDFDLLKIEIECLQDADFDMDLLGFDSSELTNIFSCEDFSDKNQELDLYTFEYTIDLKFKLNEEEYIKVKNRLSEINESPEAALLEALGV